MRKYVIMGVQGCGKGTQAKMLAEGFDLVHISVGDLFRWHVHNHTKLAARVARLMAAGGLLPDHIVEDVVKERLELHDWNYGFILDGFPRNRHQAEFFLERYDVDAVLQIDVPDPVILNRILNRRLCARCGRDYNLVSHRPARTGVCDGCSGPLTARADDVPEAVRERLREYHTQTEPVLELFGRKERVITVDGTGPAGEVQQEIRRRLSLARPAEAPAAARPKCTCTLTPA
jgi:adenylate kinase